MASKQQPVPGFMKAEVSKGQCHIQCYLNCLRENENTGCCIEINVAHKVCWPDHLDTQAGMGLQERGSMRSLRKWIRLN